MQTFKLSCAFDVKAVITQEFLTESRFEAQAEGATEFLKECQARFPEDDDQFMLAIVCNAIRTRTRHDTLNFMLASGVRQYTNILRKVVPACGSHSDFNPARVGK